MTQEQQGEHFFFLFQSRTKEVWTQGVARKAEKKGTEKYEIVTTIRALFPNVVC